MFDLFKNVFSKCLILLNYAQPEAEFKESEPLLKFKTRLKYGWFHLKGIQFFKIETGYWQI